MVRFGDTQVTYAIPSTNHNHVRIHGRHTIYYMNIEVGRKKYYLHKRYTEFLMLHQVNACVCVYACT